MTAEILSKPAEVAVLGSLIVEPKCTGDAADRLTVDDFYMPAHRLIFEGLVSLFGNGNGTGAGVDGLLIRQYLEDHNQLEAIGGQPYLEEILQSTPSAANLRYYVGVVKEKSRRRWLIEAAGKIVEAAADIGRPIAEIENEAGAILLTASDSVKGEEVTLEGILPGIVDSLGQRKDKPLGIATGFSFLDLLTGGLRRGELIVIGGRPSHGKTTFTLNVGMNLALDGIPVAVWSLETEAEILAERLLCSRAGVDTGRAMTGNLDDADHKKIHATLADFAGVRMTFCDANNVTPGKILNRTRRLHKGGLGCVIVDHLHLVRGNRRAENKNIEVGEITRDLKAMARELHIPVILLAQLNRGVEGRENRRPKLSDLRDSGSIEQDADQVWMMYRPGQYDENAGTDAELIVEKNRLGQTGTIPLSFNGPLAKFENR